MKSTVSFGAIACRSGPVLHKNSRAKFKGDAKGLCRVGLLLASEELILLLHLLHAEARGSVLVRLTLLLCGPILHPGSLTENIQIPAEDKSVVNAPEFDICDMLL